MAAGADLRGGGLSARDVAVIQKLVDAAPRLSPKTSIQVKVAKTFVESAGYPGENELRHSWISYNPGVPTEVFGLSREAIAGRVCKRFGWRQRSGR